jgi:Co/Zn/Cd efflux system component
MNRTGVVATGLVGLVGAALLTAVCVWAVWEAWIPALLPQSAYSWTLFFFLAFFSLVEIPVMTFGLRRLAAGNNPKARILALFTNSGYVFFGAVYAAPFILLTGRSGPGLALAALSAARFISTLLFWPKAQGDREIKR